MSRHPQANDIKAFLLEETPCPCVVVQVLMQARPGSFNMPQSELNVMHPSSSARPEPSDEDVHTLCGYAHVFDRVGTKIYLHNEVNVNEHRWQKILMRTTSA